MAYRYVLRHAQCLTAVFLLLLLLIICVCAGTAESYASESPALSVESVTAEAGDTVDVNIAISNNPGMLGAGFSVSYPSSLSLKTAKKGDAFSALTLTLPGQLSSPCYFGFDAQELKDSDVKNGTVLTLSFMISEAAEPGDVLGIALSCEDADFADRNLNNVHVATINGSITVQSAASSLPQITSASASLDDSGNVELTINSSAAYEDVEVMLATYTDAGKLISCNSKVQALDVGENMLAFDVADGAQCKFFIMNNEKKPCYPVVMVGEEPEPAGPAIIVPKVTAKAGDSAVKVDVQVANNPGILSMLLTLEFDESILTLTGASNGDAFTKYTTKKEDILSLTKGNKLESGCNFSWDGTSLSESDVKDGTILSLSFNVKSGAAAGVYPITLSFEEGDITDADLRPIDMEIRNGSVTITK